MGLMDEFSKQMGGVSSGLKESDDKLEFLWSVIEDKIDEMPDSVLIRLRKKINCVLSFRLKERKKLESGL